MNVKIALKALRMLNISVDDVAERAISELKKHLGDSGFVTIAYNGTDIKMRIIRNLGEEKEQTDLDIEEFFNQIKKLEE
jgi:hypothetical protein